MRNNGLDEGVGVLEVSKHHLGLKNESLCDEMDVLVNIMILVQ